MATPQNGDDGDSGGGGPCTALAEALMHDPFYRCITLHQGSEEARRNVLVQYFEVSVWEARQTGRCVFADDPEQGAALWQLPQSAKDEGKGATAKGEALARILGPIGYGKYRDIVSFMHGMSAGKIPSDAWYLSIIGVDPSAQGRGLGQSLLAPTLAEAKDAGAPCYLETFTVRNIPFYQRLGFQVVGEHHEPTTDSSYSVLLRPAGRS